MKALLLFAAAFALASCETVPFTVTYTGTVDGKEVTAGYSRQSGASLAVHQK